MADADRISLEERLAHLERVAEDLSDIVARQDSEISTLKGRVQTLMQREAEREAEGSGGVHIADQKPPHW